MKKYKKWTEEDFLRDLWKCVFSEKSYASVVFKTRKAIKNRINSIQSESYVENIVSWAEGIEGALETEHYGKVSNKEAVIAHAILNANEKHESLKNE